MIRDPYRRLRGLEVAFHLDEGSTVRGVVSQSRGGQVTLQQVSAGTPVGFVPVDGVGGVPHARIAWFQMLPPAAAAV